MLNVFQAATRPISNEVRSFAGANHTLLKTKTAVGRLWGNRSKAARVRAILDEYRLSDDLVTVNGRVPLVWWTHAPNFGDLLSPWLFTKITGRPVFKADKSQPHYFSIGSISKYVRSESIVWGSGSFGSESTADFTPAADYRAVRGPLTKTKLGYSGAEVPSVYGDPALLSPLFFHPEVPKVFEVGLVIRWNEKGWLKKSVGPGVKLIDLRRDDIEGVLTDFLSCKRIASSSLHGLIIADAYNIPSAWIESGSPTGGGFKYYDHFLAVNKMRRPQHANLDDLEIVSSDALVSDLEFDGRSIDFSPRELLDACPLLVRRSSDEHA